MIERAHLYSSPHEVDGIHHMATSQEWMWYFCDAWLPYHPTLSLRSYPELIKTFNNETFAQWYVKFREEAIKSLDEGRGLEEESPQHRKNSFRCARKREKLGMYHAVPPTASINWEWMEDEESQYPYITMSVDYEWDVAYVAPMDSNCVYHVRTLTDVMGLPPIVSQQVRLKMAYELGENQPQSWVSFR